MTNITTTNKKCNCSKAFLLAAGFFASFAGTALADDYQFSSGTHTNTGSITFAGDTSNRGKDCYEIGILLGLDKADYDSEKNAFLDYIDTKYEYYEYYDYVAFDDVFWLSGDAEYINKGTIIFQGEGGKYQPDDSNYIIETISCAIISGNAKFVNEGTVNHSDSEEYSALVLTDSATFENTDNGAFYQLEAYFTGNSSFVNDGYVGLLEVETYGSSSFVNNGNISWDKILSLHGSSRFVNNADATITNFRYADIHGNASFENNGEISLSDFYPTITFLAYEDGDASFVNNGSIGDGTVDTAIEICTSLDTDKGEKEEISNSSTGTFENNGEITTSELNVTLEVFIYAETSDRAHEIFENLNTTDRAFFENYGTITAGEVVIDSFVETTLAQGSKIDGNLTLGNASYYFYGTYYSDGIEGTFVSDKSVLNIVLNGSSETPLISGNLTLLNTTELNVSVDPNSETAEIYTMTLWGGELVLGEQTIYSYNDGQYTEGETITGSFVETSGTFVVGDETFNWVLDTNTGILTARSENLNDPAGAGYKISSGTYVNEGDLTYACDENNWGADCKGIGLLFGLSSSTYDSEKNAFSPWGWEGGEYYYEAFNAIFWLLGDAQYTNMGTITFSCTDYGDHTRFETDSDTIVTGYDVVLISGNASFVNKGTMNFEGAIFALAESATFENAKDGEFERLESVYICGNASFVNNGNISDTTFCYVEIRDNGSFVNNGTIGSGYNFELYSNASFVNEGELVLSNLFLEGEKDGNASFVNKGALTADCIGFSFYNYDGDEISNSSTGTFENYGTITFTSGCSVTFGIWVDEVTLDTAKKIWDGFSSTGRTFFKNYGTIEGDVVIDSPIETTLVQGSQIKGNLTLGNAAEYDSHIYTSSAYDREEYWGTFVTDQSVLNIVINGSSETPLISGNLTLLNKTELNVSVDPDSETAEIYTMTLWGGELVLGEQTAYSLDDDGGYTEKTITGSISTSGTFVIEGETFNWSLDTSTGVLTAKSENIEEEVEITDSDQSVSLGKNDVAIFKTDSFEGTISGSGGVYSESNLSFSGDASEHTGTTYVQGGTFTVEEGAQLGSGSYEISSDAVLEIASDREFTNATSGNGTLSIASGAEVSFTKNVGVRVIYVNDGATLKSGVTLTHSDTQLILAGELSLDASAGEQVSFTNGGTVTIEGTATLNLSSSGVAPASVRTLSNSSGLGAGSNVTIFSGATVEGDVASFLETDSTLSDLAKSYAVVYDTSKGLSITILESGNVSSISSGLKLHDGLGSDFVSAVISADDLDFGTGIKSSDELQSLSNPIVRAIATGNLSEAAAVLDTLSPLAYAAMVAMPTTSFYNDVKTIDNRLVARRGKLDENARWEFFAQAQGTFIENDDANDTQTFDFDLYGVLAGADYRVNEGLTVGLTVGYDYGKADIHNSGGKIESDDVRVTIFAGQQIGEMFFVNAGAQVGYGHYEAKRKTAYGNANGDTDGWNAGVFADVGMMLTLSEELRISARPYVGIAYMHSEVGSFDDGLLDVDDFHGDSLRASIGCGVFWGFDLAETVCSVGLDASYSHDFCGDEVDIDGKVMSTNKGFGTTAKALSENLFSVGPVVSVAISESVGVFASYAFEAGTDSSTGHSVNAGVSVSF